MFVFINMQDYRYFDVLVVYSGHTARSASRPLSDNPDPFPHNANYSEVYAYFLKACHKQGLSAALCASTDIIDAGTSRSYWVYEKSAWRPINKPCYSWQIFDKLSPVTDKAVRQREMLFSSDQVQPFNQDSLSHLFADKLETYAQLSDFAIPTVAINDASMSGITRSLRNIEELVHSHEHRPDFSTEVILKDRYGAGGDDIYKFKPTQLRQISNIVRTKSHLSFILQPFLKFDEGFLYNGKKVATDIRLIFQNKRLIQTYIRMAKKDDFRCNEHKGGTLVYLEVNQIPKKVVTTARRVVQKLKQQRALMALDFVVSNSGKVLFLEGNTGPGLDWNSKVKTNEIKSKQLMRAIVKELTFRVQRDQATHIHNSAQIDLPTFPASLL
jgi:glutathione synthase/RimK-type ligase-like ATP-grasp enzyme